MRILKVLRLLLDVYGALFLIVIIVAPLIYGVLPYEGLLRLGALPFYALVGVAFVLWLSLAGRALVARGDAQAPERP
ncbi:MAG: hypothetical protein OEW90_13110 [Betaproteobacteria bacterium]|nr:hypothetical protein [Betaproteobacteria bacterium]MDH4325069.1 hypothetical protein [Betaproteobacteria bacterium]